MKRHAKSKKPHVAYIAHAKTNDAVRVVIRLNKTEAMKISKKVFKTDNIVMIKSK